MVLITRPTTTTTHTTTTTPQTFDTEPTRQEQALTAGWRLYHSPYVPFYDSLFPFEVPIDGRKVSTRGLHRDCIRFKKQRSLVIQREDRWPCISVTMRQTDLTDGLPRPNVAPVDLGSLLGPRLWDLKPGDKLDHLVSPQLQQAGFSTVFTRSSSEALEAFISGIALVLLRRRNRLDDNTFPDPFIFCRVTALVN